MDIVPYVAAAQEYLGSHPGVDTCIGAFVAVLGAHPLQCADAAASLTAKIPPLRFLLKKNWPAIKDFLDKFEGRFGEDLASEPEQPAALPPAAPAAPAA